MKITQYVWLIVLGILLLNPGYCAEAVDDQPVLRSPLAPAASPELVLQGETATSGTNNGFNPLPRTSKLINDIPADGKSEPDAAGSQKHALQGGISHFEVDQPDNTASGEATREIAAIGISWNVWNRVINYVDPGSDLFGKVEPGQDHFLGLGKLDAMDVVRSGYNIGDSGTWVEAVIRGRDHVVRHIPVRRQPLSSFAPKFAHSLARQYRLSH